jgi:hypothetical protein
LLNKPNTNQFIPMKRSFVRVLSALLLCLPAIYVAGQSGTYGNEWIDYSKTYYKFKVGKTGVSRIYRSALSAAGIPSSVVGSNFMLYRDGKEVPLFVSNENMGGSDYIEFWATKADGIIDKELYVKPEHQPDDRISLFSDSSNYFLTYDNGNNHLRYAGMPNTIPGGTPAPLSYCIATAGFYPRGKWMPGPSYAGSTELRSPSFDNGEGFIDGEYGIGGQPTAVLATPNLVAGVNATLHACVVARSYAAKHQVEVQVNGNYVSNAAFDVAEAHMFDAAVPAAMLQGGGTNQIQFTASPQGSPGAYDVFGIGMAELEYPRNFDVAGLDQATFKLPASGSPQYLEFVNMGAGRLYDVTNAKWYNGNTAVSGKTRFYLDPSVLTRQIIIVTDNATSISSLTPLKSIQFTNWGASAAQGDFIIISHNELMQQTNGHKYVQEYADYRSSAAGGGRHVSIAEITELYDQFAYGYDIHPLSIKHFLQYAYDKWSTKPKDAFLIGRGVLYYDYPRYLANRKLYTFPIVPVWGSPGSDVDFVMFGDFSPKMRIGRLSVWNAPEIGIYLNKVQTAEQLAAPAQVPTLATELWKKRAIHIVGTNSELVRLIVEPVMAEAAKIIADTFTGKAVTTFTKASSAAVDQINAQLVDSLLRGGISQFTFYGHGSPFTFDYTLPNPESYSNGGRMSSFLALGCDIAQMFDLATQRTITERYLLAPNAGSTTVIASTNSSFTGFDDYYLYAYYRSMAYHNYGGALGTHFNFAHDSITHRYIGAQEFPNYYSAQLESTLFAGDPSISMPSPLKPDYHVTEEGLTTIPTNVTTALDSFKLRISAFNLGKAIKDTVEVKVEHINPAGAVSTVGAYTIADLHFSDTSTITIPIDKVADLGLNKLRVTIDPNNHYDEISEMNNAATLELFIYTDNLVPVYPPEFAIVHDKDLVLKASVLNAFRPTARYRLELDTTELFNSPLKQSTTINSPGGVIKWKPNIQFQDSVVYYWRTAFDSVTAGSDLQWTNSSFVYLVNGTDGWNQSHYYQYLKDKPDGLFLRNDRKFHYGSIISKLLVKNMVLCYGGPSTCNESGTHMQSFWNGVRIDQSTYGNVYNSVSIIVIDSASGRPWTWTPQGSTPPYFYLGVSAHQFNVANAAGRLAAVHYLDTIPDGNFVIVKSALWHGTSLPIFINEWKADTAIAGPGRSLYHALYNLGFTKIDSFYKERAFIFMRRKNDPTLAVYQEVTDSLSQFIEPTFDIKGSDVAGQYASTIIGPAKSWEAFKWKTFSIDSMMQTDTSSVSIIGIDKTGNETTLYPKVTGDTVLTGISAQQYPKLKLLWSSKDSVNLTSPQLAYWRVLYQPLPEAALNPAIHFVLSDTLSQGQMQTFSTAIENLTTLPMDSMLVRYKIIGADGVSHLLANKRYGPLRGLDTIHASITFDPAAYPGKNFFFIEANPSDDQPELYHPNNLGYAPFKIGVDNQNPLMDVTFDGVHILNGDIVSARPFIKVRLKDDNRYLALDDTGLLKLYLRYPSDSITALNHQIPFDGVRCRFIPATKTDPVNEAYIEFRPELVEDGTYQLSVSGLDKTGNAAGGVAGGVARPEYKITFEVDNKPSITNILNYPNPFSTATAFVFTVTGSQIPSQLKIQIMTVTGKVVREVTRNELGPLHIGRNITEYKWDGRDQYGQLLGNGVYLYRVVTSLNGQDVDLRADTREMTRNGAGIDKYFKNGYGKMYIMR